MKTAIVRTGEQAREDFKLSNASEREMLKNLIYGID